MALINQKATRLRIRRSYINEFIDDGTGLESSDGYFTNEELNYWLDRAIAYIQDKLHNYVKTVLVNSSAFTTVADLAKIRYFKDTFYLKRITDAQYIKNGKDIKLESPSEAWLEYYAIDTAKNTTNGSPTIYDYLYSEGISEETVIAFVCTEAFRKSGEFQKANYFQGMFENALRNDIIRRKKEFQ